MDESIVQSILQRLTKIETLLELNNKNLEEKVDMDIKNMDTRISKIENNNQWLWRTVEGSIIVAIIGAITITFK
jgi:iron uptake system EfeUOB component EfeO/EfeM